MGTSGSEGAWGGNAPGLHRRGVEQPQLAAPAEEVAGGIDEVMAGALRAEVKLENDVLGRRLDDAGAAGRGATEA